MLVQYSTGDVVSDIRQASVGDAIYFSQTKEWVTLIATLTNPCATMQFQV
jgi:hypothetical protein